MNWFNKNFKIVAIILFVLMGIAIWYQFKTNQDLVDQNIKLKQSESILSNNIIAANDTIEFWKTRDGKSKSEIKLLSATNEMLETQYSGLYTQYKKLVGKSAKDGELIAYLQTQIELKDRKIAELSKDTNQSSYILNDTTIKINEGEIYDSINYYNINGTVLANIKDNKIYAGRIDLTTTVGIGIDFGITRETKTGIANITSSTAFPAKVRMSGITQIERELNKKPAGYFGVGVTVAYGITLEKQPILTPFVGIGVSYTPRWLTFKIRNR